MSSAAERQAHLSIVARFPDQFFLENLAARADDSLLVTVANRNELYYVPPSRAGGTVEPQLLFTFGEMVMGLAEVGQDVFLVLTTNGYTTHECYMHRVDLRGWEPGGEVLPELILTFPQEARAVNGCCLLSPTTVLIADSFAGLIWRVDLDEAGRSGSAKVWLKHPSMAYVDADLPPPPQPGVNGVRYSASLGQVYYTTTGQKRFMRVAVDGDTFAPAGDPEEVAHGGMYDDFCLDEARGLAFVTVHRENRVDRLPLVPGAEPSPPLIGQPFDEQLVGPSSAVWSRTQGDGRLQLFVTTDGGTTAPPKETGAVSAKVVRVEIHQSLSSCR